MFVVLVGESGVARKTTSIRVATSIVRSVIGGDSPIGLIDAKVTPEKLDEILHERSIEHGHASLAIAVPELAVFLGTEQYIAHMPTMLTDLYDCPDARDAGGTIARGEVHQRRVWVSFISASTPVWLLKTVNPNVVEGGFTSRCYFVISNEPKKRIPWPEDADKDLLRDLRDDMKIISVEASVRPAIQTTVSAIEAFTRWYNSRMRSYDSFKQSFEAREDAHVLRVAALLSVNDGSWMIKRSHVNVAIRLITEMKNSSGNIFESTEIRTKYAHALDIVRAQLISAGMDPVRRSALYIKCRYHVTQAEFGSLVEVLHEIGAIQRFEFQQDRGRPVDYLRGTSLLLSNGLGENVLDRF